MLKKIIAFLIILSLVILPMTSCVKKIENNQLSPENNNEAKPIIKGNLFGDPLHFYCLENKLFDKIMTEETRRSYEEYLSDLTGYKVSYDYISNHLDFNNGEMNKYQEQGGFIYINNYTQLLTLIEQDLIVPLNEYYESNSNFKSINQSYIEAFSDDDGNVFAIPTNGRKSYVDRSYNSEWLDMLNAQVPQNIDEFTSLAKSVRRDIEVTGEKQAYIAICSEGSSIPYVFFDVFAAYGCYLNFAGVTNINYNEQTNLYEDIAVSSSFKEALTYIKYLYDNDLIAISDEWYMDDDNPKYATMCNATSLEGEKSLFLKNETGSGIIIENTFVSGWVMLKNTENKDEKINYLLNQVMVEKPLLEAFNYGIKDFHYEETAEYYLSFDVKDKDMFNFTAMKINVVNDLSKEKPLYQKGVTLEQSESYNKAVINRKQKINQIVNENQELIYHVDSKKIIPYDYSNTKQSAIINNFFNVFVDIFEKDISIENAIEAYKSKVNDSYINQLNSN